MKDVQKRNPKMVTPAGEEDYTMTDKPADSGVMTGQNDWEQYNAEVSPDDSEEETLVGDEGEDEDAE